jgi:hypothetical protein
VNRGDRNILIAAEIAEALAVTTYSNIINTAPFFTRLASDDQGYLAGALQEEMSHYLLEQSVTGQPSPFTSFFYPVNMFADAQTTLNTLVSLEDAFRLSGGCAQFSCLETAAHRGPNYGHRERSLHPGSHRRSGRCAAGWRTD